MDILKGTYTIPPDTDKWSRKILEEAHYTYALLADKNIPFTITTSNFQEYWQKANEKISSFSRLHFGHYKATSFSPCNSSLHAAKLTACSRMGVPLKRWTVGLIVFLKKTRGNNFINKMRTICLLEANFNYFNKTVFACQMMTLAQETGQIPIECFAKKGSNCNNAVITKIMYCNKLRSHHHPTCISGNGFGDCYDCVPHPPASIALQSWGVLRKAIGVLLLAMQTMRFFLRTGYGKSALSYGGSTEDRNVGLGQGNAAAGPAFLALSALIIIAYLRDGHGARILTSLSHTPTVLAGVIYIDDTNLVHSTLSVKATPMELIAHLQRSTNAWGGLAVAIGAALKSEKCFAYFMVYKYKNGRAHMGTIATLPPPTAYIPQINASPLPSHLTIPLPDGTTVPIPTLPPTTASLMLGIWFGPASRGTKHIQEMCQKGHDWADCLHLRPLRHSDAWMSFLLQLYPGMSWGLSTFVLSSHELYMATKPVYFKCLPLLGIQCHIEHPWQTLPESFQGIGLPNFALHSLAAKLQLLQCIWGFKDAASIYLLMGFETFLMEIGMYDNPFNNDYSRFHHLLRMGHGSRICGS
jgi:hypothetical protein